MDLLQIHNVGNETFQRFPVVKFEDLTVLPKSIDLENSKIIFSLDFDESDEMRQSSFSNFRISCPKTLGRPLFSIKIYNEDYAPPIFNKIFSKLNSETFFEAGDRFYIDVPGLLSRQDFAVLHCMHASRTNAVEIELTFPYLNVPMEQLARAYLAYSHTVLTLVEIAKLADHKQIYAYQLVEEIESKEISIESVIDDVISITTSHVAKLPMDTQYVLIEGDLNYYSVQNNTHRIEYGPGHNTYHRLRNDFTLAPDMKYHPLVPRLELKKVIATSNSNKTVHASKAFIVHAVRIELFVKSP